MKNNKTNIAFLDFDDIRNPLLNGGQARATFEVGTRLVKKGHKVTVISSRYPGYKDRKENGIYYKHIGLGTGNIKVNNVFYIFLLPFMVTKLNADVIIECFTAPISTLFTPLFTKTPVIALPSMFNAQEFAKKYKIPFHLIEKFGLKFYKYMLPYSHIDSKKAVQLNPNINYRIVGQGVSQEYSKIKQKKAKHILFLSRFDISQKGVDLLIKAYDKVKNEIKYPLVLAGHGPDEDKIKKLVKDLGLESKVRIVGPAYGDMKKELMSEALYVAFPSRHEEMSLWALEALSAGLPLVCFDIPESEWMNPRVCLKANPFNITQYSNLLVKVTNPIVINPMRIEARKFASKFRWEKVASEFENFISATLENEKN